MKKRADLEGFTWLCARFERFLAFWGRTWGARRSCKAPWPEQSANGNKNKTLTRFWLAYFSNGTFCSLQHNILRSFCCVLVLWNLLFYSRISICDVIVIIRKSYYSCCVGGVSPHSFIDLHVERHFESILHPVQSISKRMKYLPFFRWRHEEKESNI